MATTLEKQIKELILGYPDNDKGWHSAGGEELTRAQDVHWSIAVPVSKCFKDVDLTVGTEKLPGQIAVALMLGTNPYGGQSWSEDASKAEISLNSYQRTGIFLSQQIASARSQFAMIASSSKNTMNSFQWSIVILGALNTILVSIKSMDTGNTRPYYIIGIIAVVLSATGTAISSINSFVGPIDTYTKSERALLQLRQVHLDLVLFLNREKYICAGVDLQDTGDPKTKKMLDFSAKLKEIIDLNGVTNLQTNNPTTSGSQKN